MKKLTILTTIFLLSLTSHSFAISKKADMGPVGSCMRECVQTVNSSANDAYGAEVSVDEFTIDCVNYCNPNLKDGYCSPEGDGECCNAMYQETDSDCQKTCVLFGGGEQCQAGYECVPCVTCGSGHGLVGLCEPQLPGYGSVCDPSVGCVNGYVCIDPDIADPFNPYLCQ